jgi:hypothetical protein
MICLGMGCSRFGNFAVFIFKRVVMDDSTLASRVRFVWRGKVNKKLLGSKLPPSNEQSAVADLEQARLEKTIQRAKQLLKGFGYDY